MGNETIASYLENYNKWRRGDEEIEMPEPKELGIAIDCAISYLRHDMEIIKRQYLALRDLTTPTGHLPHLNGYCTPECKAVMRCIAERRA